MKADVVVAANKIVSQEPGSWSESDYVSLLALTREAVSRLGWLTMFYRCDTCEFEWEVYCALGCEGPRDLKEAGLALAVPYTTSCPSWPNMEVCKGTMSHVRFQDDRELWPPKLIPDDAPRFVLPNSAGIGMCGRLEIPTPALVRARKAGTEL